MLTRREFLQASSVLALLPIAGCPKNNTVPVPPNLVNDVHSQLNPTLVDHIVAPKSLDDVRDAIDAATRQKQDICIAGARHSMGGQQFAAQAALIDTRTLNRVLHFDGQKGMVTVEAGIAWPDLVAYLLEVQENQPAQWGIAQKQTGADRLCLGGALASNVHGRGLQMKPLIADIEAFDLVDGKGKLHHCSRTENQELFRLAIGGYGLFGLIYSVTLRLMPRQKVQRIVEIINTDTLMPAFEKSIAAGFLYGDFQFMTDENSDDFLRKGVFSCYAAVPPATEVPKNQKQVSEKAWNELVYLAHTDKARAYQLYADYYLSTNGQVYWSDTHQLGAYLDNYHVALDKRMKSENPATEIITELYVPRNTLHDFMEEARDDLRKNAVNVIYGTIRLIERDTESFLAWAKQPYACIIFNLHTDHTSQGKAQVAAAFQRLIDMAARRGGSYYLTYHRYASKQQVTTCYPQFSKFLQKKQRFDPEERFQSEWYRHYKKMFAAEIKKT